MLASRCETKTGLSVPSVSFWGLADRTCMLMAAVVGGKLELIFAVDDGGGIRNSDPCG